MMNHESIDLINLYKSKIGNEIESNRDLKDAFDGFIHNPTERNKCFMIGYIKALFDFKLMKYDVYSIILNLITALNGEGDHED